MGFFLLSLLSSTLVATTVNALGWTSTPFNPASIPLAVRTPYLSTWLPQGSGHALNAQWPSFWTNSIAAWAGYVKVDNVAYTFMGTPDVPNVKSQPAVQKSFTFTSTQSMFVMSAGGVDLNITFLSPIEPDDLVKQSTPFAYLSVTATSSDGLPHSVQLYTDISAEWTSDGADSPSVNWTTITGSVLTHQVQLESPTVYGEKNDRALYGSVYYSTTSTATTTYQTGPDVVVRAQFINNGTLADTLDTNYRAVSDNWPVFAHAVDFGQFSKTSEPIVWSIGFVREPAVKYTTVQGFQDRSLYFWTKYSSVTDLISDFLADFGPALARANALDAKVQADAMKISADYAAVAALSLRQAVGATEITVSKDASGAFNASDVLMFMKEISSDGNVNTADVMYPSWPAFLYLNPTWCKYLLLPLFEYQASGEYPNLYALHDMGAHYPIADGHNDGRDEAMPVEESGNMLIMTLSYTQKSGDKSLVQSYPGLLDQWTQFLVQDSLIPQNQISTDDFAGALENQTNLAIKGIIGIQAMSAIEGLLGNTAKSSNYSAIASSYVTKFLQLAKSTTGPHLTLNYGVADSWGLTYNLWAETLLGFNIFPASLYDMQGAWYKQHLSKFGVPLDTRHTYTKSDWQMFIAAAMPDSDLRDSLISAVKSYASSGTNDAPLSDWYDSASAKSQGFASRPVVGGHFALMVATSTTQAGSNKTTGSSASSPTPSSPGRSTSRASRLGSSWLFFTLATLPLIML